MHSKKENSELKSLVISLESQVEKFEAMNRRKNLIFSGIGDNVHNIEHDDDSNDIKSKESWIEC